MHSDSIDILLVEDSPDDASFFRHAVAKAMPSVRLRVARDGAEALSLLFGADESPQAIPHLRVRLVVLDLKLPKVSGSEILRRIKTNARTADTPVIILSSSRQARDVDECYRLGANSYLVKPMDFDQFDETIHLLCRYWLQYNQTQ